MKRWNWMSFSQGFWLGLFVVVLVACWRLWLWRTYYAPLGVPWWAMR